MTVAFKSEEGKKEILKYYEILLTKGSMEHEEFFVNTSYGDTFIIAMGKRNCHHLYYYMVVE